MKVTIDGPCQLCKGRGKDLVHMNLVLMTAFLGGALIAAIVAAALMNPVVFFAGLVMFIMAIFPKIYITCTGCDGYGRQMTVETREE